MGFGCRAPRSGSGKSGFSNRIFAKKLSRMCCDLTFAGAVCGWLDDRDRSGKGGVGLVRYPGGRGGDGRRSGVGQGGEAVCLGMEKLDIPPCGNIKGACERINLVCCPYPSPVREEAG